MSNKFAIYDLPSNQRESLTVFDAAERGDVKVLTKLSKVKGFDVNSKDKFGRTALMWAADCGQVCRHSREEELLLLHLLLYPPSLLAHTHTHTHTHIYIYIYILPRQPKVVPQVAYGDLSVCVCRRSRTFNRFCGAHDRSILLYSSRTEFGTSIMLNADITSRDHPIDRSFVR